MRKTILILIVLGFIFVLPFVFSKTYNGLGTYTLSPGDIITLSHGYTLKYFSYQEGVQWYRGGASVTGNLATISLFNKSANISYYGDSITVANLGEGEDGIRTFSNGFSFTINPLVGGGDRVTLTVSEGSLSSCTDTDAYTLGNTALETSSGNWGRNYYLKGTATENKEDFNGVSETKKEDTCSNSILTEYYCSNSLLKSETKKCTCSNDGACEKGSLGTFDSIKEWLGKLFGIIN